MPEVHILLLGASFTAPLLLFTVLAWTGIEHRRELGALEQRVRRQVTAMPGVQLGLVAVASPLSRRRRTAASR